ncbi:MAG: NAD(+)/NADH kinase [Candidatus Woesearchaeota archaeon]
MGKILSIEEKEKLFQRTLIVYLEGFRKESIEIKKTIERKFKTRVHSVCRKFLKRFFCNEKICKNYSLIISFGGDGTFLRTAHFVNKTPLLGINASNKKKEGFLTTTSRQKFSNDLKNEIFFEELQRIKIIINGKEIPDKAINDVFIGHKKSYKSAKYELILKEKGIREKHLSSGIIISTEIGTNAWYKSVGGVPQTNKDNLYYIVREPYRGRIYKSKHLKGNSREIRIKALKNLILVVDSLSREYILKKNDTAVLRFDRNNIKRINFKR